MRQKTRLPEARTSNEGFLSNSYSYSCIPQENPVGCFSFERPIVGLRPAALAIFWKIAAAVQIAFGNCELTNPTYKFLIAHFVIRKNTTRQQRVLKESDEANTWTK
jgi:hypothetical protein